ncbi:nuclear transport factor 2 family protein [Dactylosporangium aurantiacum]|uniref:Nuclear transport factor 2 family protein n=1 Tax=Dactylosporangium aurantiacum TaxID=35754 RepID=A0A9Q9MIA5_9ACTN|nr:nuclear transport factor 2 family protein [Dactylosporangium aurantiacum]MDG6106627.1 nuclear transport factor 2 family protein [Dactylosporangium aurantiacum]UWZ50787.1 nuclear transport factor 2 family protein [Dactylosporangium aurantiacum]
MNRRETQAAVADLFGRYLMTLDTVKLDSEWASWMFTPDVAIEFPMSRHEGIEGVADYHAQSLAPFAGTQHLSSPPVVDPDGDTGARFRAHVVSIHVYAAGTAPGRFSAGTIATGEARLTPAGWRLRRLSLQVVWTEGHPPGRAA